MIQIGQPFYDPNFPSDTVSILMNEYDEGAMVYYFDHKDQTYYSRVIPDINSKKSIKMVKDDIRYMSLHAKIISIPASVHEFGYETRRKEFKGAVLLVEQFAHSEKTNSEYANLVTNRADGIRLPMLMEDLEFVFPTIYKAKKQIYTLAKGQSVIAMRNDPNRTFKKGDVFKVKNITNNEIEDSLSLLELKSNRRGSLSVFGYKRYFKIKKK